MTTLVFGRAASAFQPASRLVLATKAQLKPVLPALSSYLQSSLTQFESVLPPIFAEKNAETSVSSFGDVKLNVTVLPRHKSRHSALIREDVIQDAVSKHAPKTGDYQIIVCLENSDQAMTAATAIARAFPLFTRKTTSPVEQRTVQVEFVLDTPQTVDYAAVQLVANGVRLASRLVDMPTSELNTDTYLEEIKKIHHSLSHLGVSLTVIQGEELKERGFGGLYGVGKGCHPHPPALAILGYTRPQATRTMAWVGKGIVFDTGGLSIKGSVGMCTMKADMGGSAAILAGFEATVLAQQSNTSFPWNLYAVLCLAENSVDALSTRPDDILTLYSGKTVEINNTDAEGRLVLADGVAYATKHLNPDVVLDMATLTGAVLVTTGVRHAGVLSNDAHLEQEILKAGQQSGDLAFPLLYAPEVLLETAKQFHSEVADMKNSVKDRMNAQSSCAGHFIEENLVGDKWNWKKLIDPDSGMKEKGLYAHIDIAGTAWGNSRGRGYGVALLFQLAQQLQ